MFLQFLTTDPERDVARGLKKLDQGYINWAAPDRIDLDKLRIDSVLDCVLGQLHGNFYEACEHLQIPLPDTKKYGFGVRISIWQRLLARLNTTGGLDYQDKLDELAAVSSNRLVEIWRRLIQQRRAEAATAA